MIARTTIFLWLVGFMFLSVSSYADNPDKLKAGAEGALCQTCHVVFREKMELRHIHAPIADGECTECHNPHASSHGSLLTTDPKLLCLNCHDDLLPGKMISTHGMVAEGSCTDCHDPHASDNRHLLFASGEKLCFECHSGIEKTLKEASVIHEPAEDGCLECHEPHASAKVSFLLTQEQPGLCLECHDSSDPDFSRSHMGYPVDSATCSVCHDPHGSGRSALLKDNVHSPVARRMCGQCHKGDPAAGTTPPADGSLDACGECHRKTVEEALESANVHWPVLDGEGCLRCHDPHASKQPDLLSEPMVDLCGGCHSSVMKRQMMSKTKHEPVMDGDCGVCHSSHNSEYEYLLHEEQDMEVCADCHDYEKHSMHPIGEEVKDPRNTNVTMDCSSCHRAHGTPYDRMFPYATYTFLCTQCHTGMRR